MQWEALITSVGGAGVVLGAVGFVLKKSFESVLDTKLKESEERNKALLAENLRRQASLYDEQYDAFKTVSGLIYRTRNLAREIADSNGRIDRQLFQRLQSYHGSIEELLFETRAIIPKDIFREVHLSKESVFRLLRAVESLHEPGSAETKEDRKKDILLFYNQLDETYQKVVAVIQAYINVKETS